MKALKVTSLIIVLVTLVSSQSFAQWWRGGIRGEGPKITKTLDVDNFDGVGLSINADLYLTQGDSYSFRIEAQENIIENIETDIDGGYLKIKFDKNVGRHAGITIWITMPTLTKAYLSGSGLIKSERPFKGLGNLEVGISGSGDIDLAFDAADVNTRISGSGDIRLNGSARNMEIRISGSGEVAAGGLTTNNCSVRISGSGDCEVNAEGDLVVSTSGSGDVYYRGRPRVKAKVSGSGEVQPKG
jgi:hypothetical protein